MCVIINDVYSVYNSLFLKTSLCSSERSKSLLRNGTFYIKNKNAAYVSGSTTKPQYLEYYNGNFTTYSIGTNANPFKFNFYVEVEGDLESEKGQDMLRGLKYQCQFVKIVGRYESGIVI